MIVELLNYYVGKYTQVDVAIRHLMNRLHGSHALVIMDKENPNVFYAGKNKSPLLIGKGEGFNMVGSDVMAMLRETNQFYELDDMEYTIISRDKIEIFEIAGAMILITTSLLSSSFLIISKLASAIDATACK